MVINKIINSKMTSIYNKLCNKKMDCFLLIDRICIRDDDNQMSQKKTIKPFDLIKSCLFYGNIFIFYPLFQC
jgi:hypothetical protein